MECSEDRSEEASVPRKAPARATVPSRQILGMRVDASHYDECVEQIMGLAADRSGSGVCVATVHMVMEAFDDPEYRRMVNSAELVTSDGVPLVWCLKLLGLDRAERVYGPTLTPRVCERAAAGGVRVGFYGGTAEVLEAMQHHLRSDHPELQIVFASAPPFRPLSSDEDEAVVSAIEDAGVEILFVGLGCPKQERWIAEHRDRLSCVSVGVGAAFDFIAGTKSQAPSWMQARGLEWLYRLVSEPRRLWRRYLYNNPRFLVAFGLQLWRERAGQRAHA